MKSVRRLPTTLPACCRGRPWWKLLSPYPNPADLKPGDRVKTFRGSTRGVIVRVLKDGRVAWRPDGTDIELTGLPESLLPDT